MGGFHSSSDGVPYLAKTQIKREAAVLLTEYGERFGLVVEPPVPVQEILELHLQLTFEMADLRAAFQLGDVLGALWIAEKTVRVDQSLDPVLHPRCKGRYRFTLAHGAGHWRLHHRFFTEDDSQARFAHAQRKPAYICRSSEAKKPVEWQADYFAAHLLMPSILVRAARERWHGTPNPVAAADLVEHAPGSQGCPTANSIVERFLRPIAEAFEVSGEAMRIRLEELGLLIKDKAELLF